MISNIPNNVLSALEQCIDQVKSNLRPYVTDPISDFTRKRKLNFEQLVRFYLQLQAKSNNSELNDYFTEVDSITADFNQTKQMIDSAFNQFDDLSGLIFHSDQGWQYQMKPYKKWLKDKGIQSRFPAKETAWIIL